ncbi:MAG TPA: hypothetical protein VF139_05605 [Candidatus Polarisedimenticolaceae bacterium]
MLHAPDGPRRRRVGILLLNPGLKSRVAPNRLNVRLARRLAGNGYWVLRVDPPGIGDSVGELPEQPLVDLWQTVQKGCFVDCVRTAAAEFRRTCRLDEVVGMGNCGGAISVLLEAGEDADVRRLVLIDVPVTLRDASEGGGPRITGKAHSRRILRAYLRRAKDWRAWLNLLSLRTDFSTLKRAAAANLAVAPAGDGTAGGAAPGAAAAGEVLNPMFVEALGAFHRRGGRALFVTAANDASTFAFDEHFGRHHLAPGGEYASRHARVSIPDSNHIYGMPPWREMLIRVVEEWLATDDGSRD